MVVGVGEVGRSTDVIYFCSLFVYCFEDARVEDWRLGSRVDADEEDSVCIFNAFDLGVECVIRAEVVLDR